MAFVPEPALATPASALVLTPGRRNASGTVFDLTGGRTMTIWFECVAPRTGPPGTTFGLVPGGCRSAAAFVTPGLGAFVPAAV